MLIPWVELGAFQEVDRVIMLEAHGGASDSPNPARKLF